jgi:short-subunit dehydrogenase
VSTSPAGTGRPVALITGATSGIGAAFARRLAAGGHDLVLVARDEPRLELTARRLADAHGVRVESLVADLSTDDGREQVAARVSIGLDFLVNNAGLSLNTPFLRSTPEKEYALLGVNVLAVMRLTLAALPAMVERRRGSVINVSSLSGFASVMPGSTYPASKAWVTNFTQSIALSVAPFGVGLLALCPGYVRTEFHQRAGIDMSKTPEWLWTDADETVVEALAALKRGKLVCVPTVRYKAVAFGMRHLPARLIQRVSRDTRGRIGRDDPSV